MVNKINLGLVSYPGGKHRVKDKILKEAPKEYDRFAEIFVGGGSVFFAEDKAKERIINDKSKELIDFYKKFRNTPCEVIRKCDSDVNHKEFKDVCKNREKNVCNFLVSSAKSYTGFCENGFSNKDRKLTNVKRDCEKYKDKLKDTKILNQDWKTVADKYCKKDTDFCFADPPYTKKSFSYREEGVTPKEVCDWAKKTKAKVLITYDNSKEVREACSGGKLHTKKFKIPYQLTSASLGHHKVVEELMIKNY